MTTLKKGDQAPNFSAKDQDGTVHTLADYQGKKLVVFFYPKANTPGCTAEACDLRDNFARFQANNHACQTTSRSVFDFLVNSFCLF